MKSIILIIIIGLAIALSGCTGSKDITSVVKALPEVQQFLNEHPTAKITTTYWSKEEVEKSANEITQQCDKPITPVAMYKATVSDGDLKFISWINADTQIVICSVTQGSGNVVKQPTSTIVQTPKRNPYEKAPQASIRASECKNGILKLQHQGGDDIILGDVRITIDQGKSSMIYEPGSQSKDKFIAGENLVFTPPSSVSLNGRTLITGNITGEIFTGAGFSTTILHIPSGQQIARITCSG
jgi:hypothetical protein